MVWQSAGYLAGLGIRKAATTSAEKARLRHAVNPSGADVPEPLLDIERMITDGYFFQLGVPWGWRDMYPDELAYAKGLNGLTVVAGVVAERTDGAWTAMFINPFPIGGHELPAMMTQPDEMQRVRFAKVPNGRPLGSPRKILIGGEVGLIFHYGHDEQGAVRGQPSAPFVPVSTTECYFARQGQMFQMEFHADAAYHERYWPCLWTMLGSWRWLR
jgi:hypothetical protein